MIQRFDKILLWLLERAEVLGKFICVKWGFHDTTFLEINLRTSPTVIISVVMMFVLTPLQRLTLNSCIRLQAFPCYTIHN